jgi:hypothetical protein
MNGIENEFDSGQLKAIQLSVSFMIEDINEELESYENAKMCEAAQTSRDVLAEMYVILNKLRSINDNKPQDK